MLKAVTFSFDDGVTQDIRLVELFNKYNVKGTFNLNSSLFGLPGVCDWFENKASHNKVKAEEVKDIYKGHEVAVHTLTHPNLTTLEESVVIRQVEKDREVLSELAGYEVTGMAYPCGGVNNDDRVAGIIKKHTGVQYSRTITSTFNFDLQDNMFRFNPSVYIMQPEKLNELAESFVSLKTDKPQIFYIWGHSYEFDVFETWEKFEELLKLVSGKDDILYGTNKEVFEYFDMI